MKTHFSHAIEKTSLVCLLFLFPLKEWFGLLSIAFSLFLFSALIQVDIGGHPYIPLGPVPLLLSVFQFLHSLLFLAVFWVLNFRSHFEALNDIFLGKQGATWIVDQFFSPKSCIPQIYLSNEVWNVSNGDRMPKLRPQEVDVPIYQNGAHSLGVSSPRIRYLDV